MVEWFSSGRRHNPLHRLVSHLDRLLRRRWVWDPQISKWWINLGRSRFILSSASDFVFYVR